MTTTSGLHGVLALSLLAHFLLPVALAQSNTTTATVSGTGLLLRVKINGAFVNFTNCTLTDLGGLVCDSDLLHDVTVTRAESTGTETWVIAMIVVITVLLVIVAGVAIGSYFYRRKGSSTMYQPVPNQQPGYYPPPEYPPQGYPPPEYPPSPEYPQGYPPQYYQASHRRVIEVNMVRPNQPPDAA
jgi:hypothetical protein